MTEGRRRTRKNKEHHVAPLAERLAAGLREPPGADVEELITNY